MTEKPRTLKGVHDGETLVIGLENDRPITVTIWDGMLVLKANQVPNQYIQRLGDGYIAGGRFWRPVPQNFTADPRQLVLYEDKTVEAGWAFPAPEMPVLEEEQIVPEPEPIEEEPALEPEAKAVSEEGAAVKVEALPAPVTCVLSNILCRPSRSNLKVWRKRYLYDGRFWVPIWDLDHAYPDTLLNALTKPIRWWLRRCDNGT